MSQKKLKTLFCDIPFLVSIAQIFQYQLSLDNEKSEFDRNRKYED
jgi:hypothetical protein